MHISLAPMEGITDSIYRRLHASMFSGVEKYFISFVSPSQHLCFTPREKYLLDPAENGDIHTVPQILAKDPALFLWYKERYLLNHGSNNSSRLIGHLATIGAIALYAIVDATIVACRDYDTAAAFQLSNSIGEHRSRR